MKPYRSVPNRYRSILIAALLASGSVLSSRSAFADQFSPTPGILIENQSTAQFTDTLDNANQNILSDKVTVTIAEVAGISAANAGITNPAYRTNTVYFDFLVKNTGNDPTQFFVPGAPAVATIGGVTLAAANIGQLQVIEYNNVTTTTAVTANNLVNAAGSTTGSLTGLPNSGSVPAGGYIKVRVPVTIPATATTGDQISVTLGNTAGQAANTNTSYLLGANGTGTNDLYTQDNANTVAGETTGVPINGDATNHRQEASSTQTTPVIAPSNISISGTVWDDANGSGTSTFTGIQNGIEIGANILPAAINAILVNSAGNVVATTPVVNNGTTATNGTYTFTNIPGAQTGLYVILSTSTGVVNSPAPTAILPTAWTNTTPLTYVSLPFNINITDITGKDFGIDRLPDTTAINTPSQVSPPGTTKYQVPTLIGTDPEDGTLGSGNGFKIVTIPAPAEGILYYNNIPVVAGATILNYDPLKLTFDPVDGVVNMSFTYAAIDAAGKVDPSPAAATMAFNNTAATTVTIAGTVWNDFDNSALGTFTNIQTGTEVGTNAVFGTTTTPVKVILVNMATGLVIGSQTLGTDGAYSFTSVPSTADVRVLLASVAGTIGAAPPTAAVPTGWVNTSPVDSGTFNSGLIPITQDFGIRQKAKLVLIKRITKINGLTTNPNDGTVLTGATTDTFNNVGNWPANYLVGQVNAGFVKPSDTIEYTIYFLNNQGADATKVKLCDPIQGNQDYVPNTIELNLGGNGSNATDIHLTDALDSEDRANSYAAGSAPTDCNVGAASSAAAGIAIGITGLATTNQPAQTAVPGAIGVGLPEAAYGLFRFTTKVKS
jgi:hypothetical protein